MNPESPLKLLVDIKSLLKEVQFHIIQLSCRPWQRSHKDYYKDYRTLDCGDFVRGC